MDFPFEYRMVYKDGAESPWHIGHLEYTVHGTEVRHRIVMPELPNTLGDGDQIEIQGAVPAQHPFRATN